MVQETYILSREIRSFISLYLDSVSALEILLLLRTNREREWTIDQISTELRSSSAGIEARALMLVKKGLLKTGTSSSVYQYRPRLEELDLIVLDLAQLYPKNKNRIIEQIYSPKKTAVQEFADAFKLKREDENG